MRTTTFICAILMCVSINHVTARAKQEVIPESLPPTYFSYPPECYTNKDCGVEEACVSQRCDDPCLNYCGDNAYCQVTQHTPTCRCNRGFFGNPVEGCYKKGLSKCTSNEDCPADRLCDAGHCKDPCITFCGENTLCHVIKHFPVCSCTTGYIGNPVEGCHKPGVGECTANEDCASDKACISHRCEDPCINICGTNTTCQTIKHIPVCSCKTGFIGNAIEGCQRLDCLLTSNGTSINNAVNKKKYYYLELTERLEWPEAFQFCKRQNRRMATVTSKDENDALVEVMELIKLEESIWIGGIDLFRRRDWRWMTTGEPIIDYTNWHDGEPLGEYNCLMYGTINNEYKWYSNKCSLPRPFICESFEQN